MQTTIDLHQSAISTEKDVEVHDTTYLTTGRQKSAWKSFLRIFGYGQTTDYALLCIGVLASVASGVALAMVNVVMGGFVTIITRYTTGSGFQGNFMDEVQRYALYFVYLGIARLVLTYVYSTTLTYAAMKITRNLRHAYLRSALSQEIGFFDQGTAGSISMQATSNGKLIQAGTAEKLGQIFQALATFVAAFIIAFINQWKLTLILLCILPALLIIVSAVGAVDAGLETKVLKTYAQAAAFAESVLGNIRAAHAFNLGPKMTERYSEFLQDAWVLGKKKNWLYAIMFGGEYFVIFAGMGLAFWQGISMIARGEVDNVGIVFTVLFSVIIAASTINSVAPHMVTFSRAATAATELFSLIDRASRIDPLSSSGSKPDHTVGAVRMSGVSFSYPTRPHVKVLDDFTLDFPAGKVTALVGASGSGKSTIIGLLERWYDPAAGGIHLDGCSIDQLNLKWLRTNVRLVQQEPVLFNGSVFDNISNGLVGTPWEAATREERMERVRTAAKTAFAHDFIQDLPQGYDTRIGERGGLLSGGQKQRIAIARSIISQPKILLLDEATSALDPHAEGIVQRALDEAAKDRTTIVIAHKLKTIRDADNIVVMQKGRIVEQGRHEQLVARGGAYAKLVQAQDLAPKSQPTDSHPLESDQDSATIDLTKTQSLHRPVIGDLQTNVAPKNREDYDLAPRTGLLTTIVKLMKTTPELRAWYALVIIVCIIGAGVYPGQAVLLGDVLSIFASNNIQTRGNFVSLMFFVMALGLLIVFATLGWATNVIAQTLSMKIRRDTFGAMLRQDLRFFDRPENTVGSLTSRIDSYAQSIFELMGFSIALVLVSVATIVVCSVLAIAISWRLGLVGVFAGIPPMVLAGYIRIRSETKMDTVIDEKFSTSASIASETVTAIRTVSSLAIEDDVLRRYTGELDSAIAGSKIPLLKMMVFFSFTQSVEYLVLALGFWYGSKLIFEGSITFYQFIVSFMSVYFSGQGCGIMFGFASSFTKANSAANYFLWLTQIEPTVREMEDNDAHKVSPECEKYGFNNIHFAYPLAPDHRVLSGVDFRIESGQFVAFVGASGCGKSTMIALLERYYDPISGCVTIDEGCDLSTVNPRLYRNVVSLVQQEPTLFPGSIRYNISIASTNTASAEVDDKIIEDACRAANAWDFISSLPEGLNTQCGDRGTQLSGGQRQRIAIARALVRNPRVILLDEATSALDTESEKVVQKALMEVATTGKRITIAVAHRLSTVRDADRIFVFYGGRIVEAGTHAELMSKGGMYTKMCEAQSLDSAVSG